MTDGLTREELLKLRLAARTLLEWKITCTSDVYRLVLRDILKCHPYASTLGLQPSSAVFSIDERGTFLWFLSETLLSDEPQMQRYTSDDVASLVENISSYCLEALIEYGTDENADTSAWDGGPTRAYLLDTVLQCLNSNRPSVSYRAYTALATMLIEDQSFRQRLLKEFIDNIPHMEEMEELRVHGSAKGRTFLIIFLQLTIGIVLLLSAVHFDGRWHLFDLRLSYLIWASIVLIPLMVRKYHRAIYSLIRSSILIRHRNLLATIVSQLRREPVQFVVPFENLCYACPDYLASVLLRSADVPKLLFSLPRKLTKETLSSVLELLRNAEVDLHNREIIFRWSCSVVLVQNDEGRSQISLV